MFLAKAGVARTLVQVFVVFFTTLTLIVFAVFYPFLLWIENLKLHLVNVTRSRLVEPAIQAFIVLAKIIDLHFELLGTHASQTFDNILILIFTTFNFLFKRNTFLKK